MKTIEFIKEEERMKEKPPFPACKFNFLSIVIELMIIMVGGVSRDGH